MSGQLKESWIGGYKNWSNLVWGAEQKKKNKEMWIEPKGPVGQLWVDYLSYNYRSHRRKKETEMGRKITQRNKG